MQKVYLLLRHNQQTGPYNLEELLQFDLKPFDLIWIEGRSAGWYYPQEIPALQPHLSFLKSASKTPTPPPLQAASQKPLASAPAKNIFVSMPTNSTKEEPTPKPSFAPLFQYENESLKPPEAPPLRQPEELRTTYAKPLEEVETEYMNWAYQRKPKKKSFVSAKGVLIACLMIGVAFASWMLLQPSNEVPVTTLTNQTAYLPEQNELPADTVAAAEENEPVTIQDKNKNEKRREKPVSSTVGRPMEGEKTTSDEKQIEVVGVTGQTQNEAQTAPEIQEDNTSAAQEMPSEPIAAESPNRKKKLREKIADLFKKKPENQKEEAKPVEEENGERRSVRRETGANLAQMMTVRFTIPNDWMLGIKGAKATLTNRSSEAIVKAVVEVVYYNDDNDVLDKRTISFGSIKSKQSQTVSVPDHQTATRLEYNVVSATAAGEPFAMK